MDGLEALLTPSWPRCCRNVNKPGERASGVIRPTGKERWLSIARVVSVFRRLIVAFGHIQLEVCFVSQSFMVHFVHCLIATCALLETRYGEMDYT